MLFTDQSRGGSFSKDPAVVRFLDRYFMYYTIPPKAEGAGYAIGIAASGDLEHWMRVGEMSGEAGVEQNGICAPGAIVLGDTLHLFYQTYGNGREDAICHATSKDGLHFSRDTTNPVYRPSKSWCCGRAIDADVVEFHGKLLLYIATRDHAFQIQMLGVAAADMDSDFSKDCWTELLEAPVLKPELPWEGACIEAPATIVQDGKVYLFYGGSYNCTPQQVGCAVSEDGIHFKRVFDTPFLPNGAPGTWNSSESGHPYVFSDYDGRNYLFYQGSDDNGKSWQISKVEITFPNGVPKRINL